MLKNILFRISFIILSIVIGTTLLITVFLLPTQKMKENVARSSEIYNYEGIYPQLVNGYKSTQLDNNTDAIMLSHAIFPGRGNVLSDAMQVNSIRYTDLSLPLSVTSYANRVDAETFQVSYPHYWHGYLVYLKPLLLFLDFGDIRMLNMLGQGLCIMSVIILMIERKLKNHAIAFGAAILLITPMATALSFQYTSIFYIIMFTFIYMLKTHVRFAGEISKTIYEGRSGRLKWEHIHGRLIAHYSNIFLAIGILCAYFDFLTYPVASCGLPLILFWILEQERDYHWKQQLKIIVLFTLWWGIGYVCMWAGKIVMGSILSDDNLWQQFFSSILLQTSANGGGGMKENIAIILENFSRSLRVILKWPYVITFGGLVIYYLLRAHQETGKFFVPAKVRISKTVPFIVMLFFPLLHIFVAKTHVYWHYWFTYRELSITLFAGYCILIACIGQQGIQESGVSENF